MPEWTGIGTSSFKPTIGESAKGWRLSPKRRAVHPYAVDVDSTVLQPSNLDSDNDAVSEESSVSTSPWFSRKDEADKSTTGFGFVPQTISGDAKLSTNEIAMFGQAKSVQLSVGEVKGQQARWLEPNRTVVLDNGTVIHAKDGKAFGSRYKSRLRSKTCRYHGLLKVFNSSLITSHFRLGQREPQENRKSKPLQSS